MNNLSSDKKETVYKIMVDNKPFDWTRQFITRAEIVVIGNVPVDYDVYLKVNGPGEDLLISEDVQVDLSQPGREHFYSKAAITRFEIIVNARSKEWLKNKITYAEVVVLAFGNIIHNGANTYTVTYDKGPKENPNGSMVEGTEVFVKNRMVFNVTATVKS